MKSKKELLLEWSNNGVKLDFNAQTAGTGTKVFAASEHHHPLTHRGEQGDWVEDQFVLPCGSKAAELVNNLDDVVNNEAIKIRPYPTETQTGFDGPNIWVVAKTAFTVSSEGISQFEEFIKKLKGESEPVQ